jgi:hypothetical protein
MADEDTVKPEVQYYLNHIAAYDREFASWETRAKKILKRYRDDTRNSQDSGSRFNILWSNVQTLKAATFARLPKPDVSRRFRDNDQVGRVAALLLERALDYEITHYPDYRETLTSALYDRFLPGRGVAWVRYEPKFKQGQAQITEDEESPTDEMLDYECAPCDYVHWRDFGHNVARTWEETCIVWRKVYMTRPMLRERFGDEIAKKIPLDSEPSEMKNASKEGVDKRAMIIELWDKETGKAVWMSKSFNEFLDEQDDPLQLEGFYPCPKPLYSTITNESLVPVPDFALYQDQANSLDILSDRIDGLVKALQVKGVYDAASPELARLFTEANNNDLIPVKNWMSFSEKRGLAGSIDMVDLTPIAGALMQAYQAFEQVKSQIYDITGISDIVRGQSVASETATAQQIKGQYASLRLKSYQDDVARFATHMIQLKAQIICQLFDPQTILMMSAADQLSPVDQQLVPQALELLRNEPMRSFRIEISTDSLIMMDESQEKQDRMEFLGAVSSFLEKAVQASQVAPQIVPLSLDMLKFGVGAFKIGKSMEGQIDQTAQQFKEQLEQQQQQPEQPPPPDPEEMKMQLQMQMDQAKMQAQAQTEQMKMQAQSQTEQMKLQAEAQFKQADQQHQTQLEMAKMEHQTQLKLAEAQSHQAIEQAKLEADADLKMRIAQLDAQTKIAVARIGAAGELPPDMNENGEPIPDPAELRHAAMQSALMAALQNFSAALDEMRRPKTIVRGPDGRVLGIQ